MTKRLTRAAPISRYSLIPLFSSRADLIDAARRKQHQIDANQDFIEELQRQQHALYLAKRNGMNVPDELEKLRAEIQRDEQQLQRLGAAKKASRALAQESNHQRQVLQCLQNESHAKDVDLRQAAGRIMTLQKQRDLMHQRRLAAENAAIAQQQRLAQKGVEELYGQVSGNFWEGNKMKSLFLGFVRP
jgi:hypothetical protein